MLESAGALLYRPDGDSYEVILVHPSGAHMRRAAWSIPKGLPEPNEDLEQAARRETWEETGIRPGQLEPIGQIEYRSGRKRVHGFIGQVSGDSEPYCASWEVDRAEFVGLETAYRILHPDQIAFLNRLVEHLRRS